MRITLLQAAAVVAMLACGAGRVNGQTDPRVAAGLRLLPPEARPGAEVLIDSGAGLTTKQNGTNGWTCLVWASADRLSADCHHRVLRAKIDLERQLAAEGLSGAAIRERFAALMESGHLSIPPGSIEITASGTIAVGAAVPDAMQGYYYVYFPFATAETLGLPATNPGKGLPYLHHGGTADAHIMWDFSGTM